MAIPVIVDRGAIALDLFITGLKTLHALESRSAERLENQMARAEPYPDLHATLRRHLEGTAVQLQRLEAALARHGERPSMVEGGGTSMAGDLPGAQFAPAPNAVLVDLVATFGIESCELAAYEALIVLAEKAGSADVAALEASRSEEERMVEDLRAMVKDVTVRFVALAEDDADIRR